MDSNKTVTNVFPHPRPEFARINAVMPKLAVSHLEKVPNVFVTRVLKETEITARMKTNVYWKHLNVMEMRHVPTRQVGITANVHRL
jgi:hypothetical protein